MPEGMQYLLWIVYDGSNEPERELTEEEKAALAIQSAQFQAQREAERREREERQSKFKHKALSLHNGNITSLKQLEESRKSRLQTRVALLHNQNALDRINGEGLAQREGLKLKMISPDGRVSSVEGTIAGVPRFNVTHNEDAADTISTDEVWPGGSTGYNLTGSGRTLGIWDGGDVLLSHNEFTSGGVRVFDKDGVSTLPFNPHPSAVSGTLVAKGVSSGSKGMSYEADLWAYDWNSDISEMGTNASNFRISNHSYGIQVGWGFVQFQGNPNCYRMWWGDISLSTSESWLFGFYDTDAQQTDEIAYDSMYYLPVWSAGNDRDDVMDTGLLPPPDHQDAIFYTFQGESLVYVTAGSIGQDGGSTGFDTISNHAIAKNIITVGAVDDISGGYTQPSDAVMTAFSTWGPTDDGRIKPDLVGNGVGLYTPGNASNSSYASPTFATGTSFSSPNVAGSLNLLAQLHEDIFGTENPMLASTLKAIAIHTADDAGNTGPDYTYGWGLMNTQSAADLIKDNIDTETQKEHCKEVLLPDSEFIEFPVIAQGNGEPIKVTICWTDPAGTPTSKALDPTDLMLVNDLDLRVIRDSDSTEFMPWRLDPENPGNAATNGDNFRDNVEQVVVASPTEDAIYIIRVTHKNDLVDDPEEVSAQQVSIIITGNKPQPAPLFKLESPVVTESDDINLMWESVVGEVYKIQSTDDLTTAFTDLTGEIHALQNTISFDTSMPTEDKYFYRLVRVE